jgi:glycosyltransferase involved in cell wall biosynthesis
MNKKIVAAIPVRDGAWIIGKALDVLSNFCHKIVVLDDSSVDNTKEVCMAYEKVDWYEREYHDQKKREEGLQRQELMDHVVKHNPEYVLFLDCDEIPTPSFIKFIENLDEDVNLWSARFINLFEDDKHYRVDNFTTPSGVNVAWDPFRGEGWRKWMLMKYDKNIEYQYDIKCERGPCGSFHAAPDNVSLPHSKTEDFYVVHYGKLGEDFISGEKNMMYAHQDHYVGRGSLESRIRHHKECASEATKQLERCPDEWFWK